jgi:hypothetical protein
LILISDGRFLDHLNGCAYKKVERVARGLRADEKLNTPVTQLVGKHDPVTKLYRDRIGWNTYTTCEVSRKGEGLAESVRGRDRTNETKKLSAEHPSTYLYCYTLSASSPGCNDLLQVTKREFPGRHYFLFEPRNIKAVCQAIDEVMAGE